MALHVHALAGINQLVTALFCMREVLVQEWEISRRSRRQSRCSIACRSKAGEKPGPELTMFSSHRAKLSLSTPPL